MATPSGRPGKPSIDPAGLASWPPHDHGSILAEIISKVNINAAKTFFIERQFVLLFGVDKVLLRKLSGVSREIET